MIRRKILLLCLALVLLISGVSIITVTLSIRRTINELAYENAEIRMEQAYETISSSLEASRSNAIALCSSDSVQTLLFSSDSLSKETLADLFRQLENETWQSGFLRSYVYPYHDGQLYLWDSNNLELHPLSSTEQPDWYSLFQEQPDQALFYAEHPGELQIIKRVYSTETWEVIGFLSVHLDGLSLMSNSGLSTQTLLLFDSSGRLCYPYSNAYGVQLDQQLPTHITTEQEDYLLLDRHFSINNWTLVGTFSIHDLTSQGRSVVRLFLAIAVVTLLISIGLAIAVSNSITKPLTTLTQQMHNYEENGAPILIPSRKMSGELAELYHSYQEMATRVHSLIEEVYIAKIEEQEAEMRALQAQINPHFIYNTLDSINWMAAKYHATEIQQMIFLLSSMLRHSLNNGENEITIRGELEQLKSYIGIHQIRTPDLFNVHYNVDPSLLDCIIIKLLLQPLVENSIEHGFEGLDYTGSLRINIQHDRENIILEVQNNGKPLDLQKIQWLLDLNSNERVKSYGIRNVTTRLVTRYGEAYPLRYTYDNGWTTATITIPLEESISEL